MTTNDQLLQQWITQLEKLKQQLQTPDVKEDIEGLEAIIKSAKAHEGGAQGLLDDLDAAQADVAAGKFATLDDLGESLRKRGLNPE